MSISNLPRYESYKDSGVDWLRDVPGCWEIKPIRYLAEIRNGQDHKHVIAEEGYPVYGSGGQFASAVDYLFDGEAVLLGRKGTIDRPLYVKGRFWTVDTMFYAVPKSNVNGRFFFYCCTGIPFSFYSTSTALPSMTQADLNGHYLAWPSFQQQELIARFLDKKTTQIDEAIAIKEQQIALLKERKQIIIQKAVTQGLDPNVPMKDSGVDWIGEIPAHWDLKRLKYVTKIVKRIVGYEGPDVLSITQRGMKIKNIDSGEGQLAMDYSKYQIVEVGDFAMNHMDLLTGYVDISKFKGVVSPDYRVFVRTYDGLDDEFLLAIFQLGYRQKIFYRYGQGVSLLGRWRLPAENFNNFFVPIPPKEEQKLIFRRVIEEWDKVDKGIALLLSQIGKLKEYKATLINCAVTGKIKITPDMVGADSA